MSFLFRQWAFTFGEFLHFTIIGPSSSVMGRKYIFISFPPFLIRIIRTADSSHLYSIIHREKLLYVTKYVDKPFDNQILILSYLLHSHQEHIDGYLATPNGTLKKYNHKSGEITIICTDMPYDSSYYDENGNLIDNKTNEY